jgi:hypothetical protein
MTMTPTNTAIYNEQPPFKHITFDSKYDFSWMVISRKSLVEGIAFHDVVYRSTEGGYDVTVWNLTTDGQFTGEQHGVTSVVGSIQDADDPAKLSVTMDNTCLRLVTTFGVGVLAAIDIIPLSEIHVVRFDSLVDDNSTGLESIIFRSRDDLKELKERKGR